MKNSKYEILNPKRKSNVPNYKFQTGLGNWKIRISNLFSLPAAGRNFEFRI